MSVAVEMPVMHVAMTEYLAIDRAVADLEVGSHRLAASTLEQRIGLAQECIRQTSAVAAQWVQLASFAKRIPVTSSALAEEILCGPMSVLRYLQLIIRTLNDLKSCGEPRLPQPPRQVNGQIRVATFPTHSLYDPLVFRSIHGETWLQPEVSPAAFFGDTAARLSRRLSPSPKVALVLGAGNVAAIPATDALTMIFQNDSAVLLKMNPVNEYLGQVFEKSLRPLIQAGFLRIIYGGAEQGGYCVRHCGIDLIHITGSVESHDAIVWGSSAQERLQRRQLGQPLTSKPVTSELGNVTPWIVVPGEYSAGQLAAQAQNVASSILNNASFNCIASKVLITWKSWPDRDRFLDMVSAILDKSPTRYAYYPGAAARFAEFSGRTTAPDEDGHLPWILRRNVSPHNEPHLFERESFVCVTAETAIEASSPLQFLGKAVEFANEHIFGSLAVALTVPDSLQKKHSADFDASLRQLRYGTVGINLWPGVAYGLMSPPWGAYPDANLSNVQSGIGFVHNTYLLDRPQKTVLRSPLVLFPKPVWFATNRRAQSVSWALSELYKQPSHLRFLKLFGEAVFG